MTAITATATSKSTGVRIGRPRRGVHVAFGVGKVRIGRLFLVPSYPTFRRRTTRITGFAWLCAQIPHPAAARPAAAGRGSLSCICWPITSATPSAAPYAKTEEPVCRALSRGHEGGRCRHGRPRWQRRVSARRPGAPGTLSVIAVADDIVSGRPEPVTEGGGAHSQSALLLVS
jgi:hypothetical protein